MGSISAPRLWQRKEVIVYLLLATAVPFAYALYTNHIWEDYFITFRHSQNLVEGKGLVYNEGQRVHGFTSPLGVLLPALCYLVAGKGSYVPALWLFRTLSILAFVTGGFLIVRKMMAPPAKVLATYAFIFLYTLEAKSIAFTTNGMETGFLLLFVGCGIFLWDDQRPRVWLWRGLVWAGLMWTRPDGCVYIAALALTEFFFRTTPKRQFLASVARSVLVTTAVYVPWFAFAWAYYGSPVPQTILAKTPVYLDEGFTVGMFFKKIHELLPHRAAYTFAPIYFPMFWKDGPDWMYKFAYATGIFGLVYWLIPVKDRFGRMASLCYTLLCMYLSYLAMPFPWYIPAVGVFAMIALARGIVTLASAAADAAAANGLIARLRTARLAAGLTTVAFAAVGAGVLGVLGMTVREIAIQESVIEIGNRMRIGLWLKDHVRPGEVVFLEPIGYVGYFSQAKMKDWPGLVSPDVVALRRDKKITLEQIATVLKPDWALFRIHEAKSVIDNNPQFLANYLPVKAFDVKSELKRHEPIPGPEYVYLDAIFLVFKKRVSPNDPTVPPGYAEGYRDCERYIESLRQTAAGEPLQTQGY